MNKTILYHIARVILGGVFVFSAISKLLSIDNFELYIFSQHLIGFDLSGIAARIIISAEMALGVLLIFNFYFNIVSKITLYVLLFFSLFLAFKLVVSSNENCHCFGDIVNFNPGESLLKNFVLILIVLFIRNKRSTSFRFSKWAVSLILFISFSLPAVVSPPDIIYRKLYPNSHPLNSEFIQLSDSTLAVAEGKKLLAFFSMGCKYCLLAAHKISIIADKMHIHEKIYYIFFGDEKNMDGFWEKSQSKHFPYVIIPFEEVFQITGGHMPSVFFVENGYVKQRRGYRDLTEGDFKAFFEE